MNLIVCLFLLFCFIELSITQNLKANSTSRSSFDKTKYCNCRSKRSVSQSKIFNGTLITSPKEFNYLAFMYVYFYDWP